MESKRLDETFSAGNQSRLLYSRAPTTKYFGGESNYQAISNVRPPFQPEGNVNSMHRTNLYLSQQVPTYPQSAYQSYEQYGNAVNQNQQPVNHHLYSSMYAPQNYQNYAPQYRPQKRQNQRQFIPFRPIMANELNRIPQQAPPKLNQRFQQPVQTDFKIFCPACHEYYYNSEVDQHIERHYLYNTDQFKIDTHQIDMTAADSAMGENFAPSRDFYPLIEPLEFQCKELDQVNYLNKFKLENKEINKKQALVRVNSQGTQFARPPLQKQSDETDLYSCFDNIFNSDNKFSMADLTKNNKILASKRELEDWEKLKSKKQGYTIKENKDKSKKK